MPSSVLQSRYPHDAATWTEDHAQIRFRRILLWRISLHILKRPMLGEAIAEFELQGFEQSHHKVADYQCLGCCD